MERTSSFAARAVDNESPLRVILVQGIARGDKMDWILQKATELGVACIAPVVTDRTEVRLDAERADKKSAPVARGVPTKAEVRERLLAAIAELEACRGILLGKQCRLPSWQHSCARLARAGNAASSTLNRLEKGRLA